MYEDEPSGQGARRARPGPCSATTRWAGRSSARADVVSSVPVPDIAAYHDARYVPGNIVVAAAGNVDHDAHRGAGGGRVRRRAAVAAPAGTRIADGAGAPAAASTSKDTEQYHLCLGAPGIPRGDDRRFALRVLDTILGGSTLVAALPGGAREARPGLLGLLLLEPVRGLRPGGRLRGHPAGQRRRGAERDRRRAAPAAGRTASTAEEVERAQGEREGPHGALDGVHARRA